MLIYQHGFYLYRMKIALMIFACTLLSIVASAQKSQLALDEHNKYIYYQVVDLPMKTEDALSYNASAFVKSEYAKNETATNYKKGSVGVADKFLIYTTLTKRTSGEISYTLTIESKPGKYRYWITNFKFTPFQRDRYGNFVPQVGLQYALEDASKFDKKELDTYLNQTAVFCTASGEKLKQFMSGAPAPKKEEITKKVVTEQW